MDLKSSAVESKPNFFIQISGMPSPIFESEGKVFFINSQLKMTPYAAPYPAMSWQTPFKWAAEPWNHRVLAITDGSPPTILEMREGETRFHVLFAEPAASVRNILPYANSDYFNFISALPDQRETIVARADKAAVFVVGTNGLSPWQGSDTFFKNDLSGASAIFESKVLSADIIIDDNNRIALFTNNKKFHDLGEGGADSTYELDLPGVGALLSSSYSDNKHLQPNFVIKMNISGSKKTYSYLIPQTSMFFSDMELFHVSQMFKQVMRVHRTFWPYPEHQWQVLTSQGFVNVAGGETWRDPGLEFPVDLKAIRTSLIEGPNRWYLYDGHKIQPIIGSTVQNLGPDVGYADSSGENAFDLPAIGHVLVVRQKGIFDLTSGGRLIKQGLPHGNLDNDIDGIQFYNWPAAGIALELADNVIYAVHEDLSTVKISADLARAGFLLPYPGTYVPLQALIIPTNTNQIYLAADTALSGASICETNLKGPANEVK